MNINSFSFRGENLPKSPVRFCIGNIYIKRIKQEIFSWIFNTEEVEFEL